MDNATGQLDDGSVGMIINEGDILEKRKGFVRGLQEQFTGVVCGLFKYTDDCGREWMLVADEDGISIRQPFLIPTFTQSDAYPFDSFSADPPVISTTDWRNTSRYVQRTDKLAEVSGGSPMASTVLQPAEWLRWFKEATNLSYQVRIEYEFDQNSIEQHQGIVIKGNGDLLTGAYLQAEIRFADTGIYQVTLLHRDAAGNLNTLAGVDIIGTTTPATGFLTLKYARDITAPIEAQFIPSIEVAPRGGSIVTAAGSLNALQDTDLGQVSATGVGHVGALESLGNGVKVIDGGPL